MPCRILAVLFVSLGACSSDGSSGIADGPGSDGQPAPGDAPRTVDASTAVCQINWLENGAQRCASGAIAFLGVSAADDSLDITGVAIGSGATGINFIVTGAHPFAVPQTFDCGPPQPHSQVLFTYTPTGTSGTATSCSVTVNQIGAVGGANAEGTFSAVIGLSGGGTATLSNGTFDVPRRE